MDNPILLQPETKGRVQQLLNERHSVLNICRIIGCNRKALCAFIDQNGLKYNNGGYTIAVFGDHKSKKQKALELYNEKRANYVAKADYSKDSKIEKIVKGIIDSIEVKNKLKDYR